ncbi:hypothetical protein M885DRAFT_622339 [Pelagophyceae sp. CCMP2097]|nr:hypothetical protein M885DRAFT_622339 [Pelagophyceae sp. CCMP2097]
MGRFSLASVFGFDRPPAADDVSSEYGDTLVWSRPFARTLLRKYHVWAVQVGAGHYKDTSAHPSSLPAVLTADQEAFARTKRVFGVADDDATSEPAGRARLFSDLTARGYYCASACRYGGDFVIYKDRPETCHSSHTVRYCELSEPISTLDVAGFCRVQGSVLKRGVFTTAAPRSRPIYVTMAFNQSLSADQMKKETKEEEARRRDV